LAALQRKRRVVELRWSIDTQIRNVKGFAKSYKFFSIVCNWKKKLWNGFEKKIWCLIVLLNKVKQDIRIKYKLLNNIKWKTYKLERNQFYGSFVTNIKINFIRKSNTICVTNTKMSLFLKRVVLVFFKSQ
jgi:hypothetical protein